MSGAALEVVIEVGTISFINEEYLVALKKQLSQKNKKLLDVVSFDNVVDITVDPLVLLLKGMDFYLGYSVDQNYETAFRYISLAAEKGHATSQSVLGLLYLEGEGVERNERKAFENISLAAEQGDLDAKCNLGALYLAGRGVEQNDQKAFEYAQQASMDNHPHALCMWGVMYVNGRGVEQNFFSALAAFRMAADQNYALGQYHLGMMYHLGLGVESNDEEAITHLVSSAAQGYVPSLTMVGRMYMEGSGVEQDDGIAFRYFKIAAEEGDPEAQNELGDLYLYGRGCEQSDEMAFKNYSLAADQGDVNGLFNRGLMYASGTGVQYSHQQALHNFHVAEMYGHPTANEAIDKLASEAPKEVQSLYRKQQARSKSPTPDVPNYEEPTPSEPVKRIYRRANELPDPNKSRNAAVNRTSDRISVRVSPQFLENVEVAAHNAGLERGEWFISVFEQYLATSSQIEPADYPDYKASKSIDICLSPSLMSQVRNAAENVGLKPAKWIRRVSNVAISSPDLTSEFDDTPTLN